MDKTPTHPVDIGAMRHLIADTSGAFRHWDARPMLKHALADLEQERARNAELIERLEALQSLVLVEPSAA